LMRTKAFLSNASAKTFATGRRIQRNNFIFPLSGFRYRFEFAEAGSEIYSKA
jgi:hypothetical protein